MLLINLAVLHNILRNVSLHLTENYELIAGTKAENINLCYEIVKITVIGNTVLN